MLLLTQFENLCSQQHVQSFVIRIRDIIVTICNQMSFSMLQSYEKDPNVVSVFQPNGKTIQPNGSSQSLLYSTKASIAS